MQIYSLPLNRYSQAMAEGAPASEEGGFWVKTLAKGASTAGAIRK